MLMLINDFILLFMLSCSKSTASVHFIEIEAGGEDLNLMLETERRSYQHAT